MADDEDGADSQDGAYEEPPASPSALDSASQAEAETSPVETKSSRKVAAIPSRSTREPSIDELLKFDPTVAENASFEEISNVMKATLPILAKAKAHQDEARRLLGDMQGEIAAAEPDRGILVTGIADAEGAYAAEYASFAPLHQEFQALRTRYVTAKNSLLAKDTARQRIKSELDTFDDRVSRMKRRLQAHADAIPRRDEELKRLLDRHALNREALARALDAESAPASDVFAPSRAASSGTVAASAPETSGSEGGAVVLPRTSSASGQVENEMDVDDEELFDFVGLAPPSVPSVAEQTEVENALGVKGNEEGTVVENAQNEA